MKKEKKLTNNRKITPQMNPVSTLASANRTYHSSIHLAYIQIQLSSSCFCTLCTSR